MNVRERERVCVCERERVWERVSERASECVCVYVCVCEEYIAKELQIIFKWLSHALKDFSFSAAKNWGSCEKLIIVDENIYSYNFSNAWL
jgi:hypothetical protein